jgi:hypothetical protein
MKEIARLAQKSFHAGGVSDDVFFAGDGFKARDESRESRFLRGRSVQDHVPFLQSEMIRIGPGSLP